MVEPLQQWEMIPRDLDLLLKVAGMAVQLPVHISVGMEDLAAGEVDLMLLVGLKSKRAKVGILERMDLGTMGVKASRLQLMPVVVAAEQEQRQFQTILPQAGMGALVNRVA